MEQTQINLQEATEEQLTMIIMSVKSNMADAFLKIEEAKSTQERMIQEINEMQVTVAKINKELESRKTVTDSQTEIPE